MEREGALSLYKVLVEVEVQTALHPTGNVSLALSQTLQSSDSVPPQPTPLFLERSEPWIVITFGFVFLSFFH